MHHCEFFLLRYVPDLVKDEFINIGVVLSESTTNFADVRFTSDWSRARCLNADADVEMLDAMHSDLRRLITEGGASRERIFNVITQSFSNTIQLSPVKACLTRSPQIEIEQLAKLYLESARPKRVPRARSGRQEIFARMQDEFEKAGVWQSQLLRKGIAASDYTHDGDPLRIDCGYKPNGVVRLFHALSPLTDPDSAKVLAFSYPHIAEGIRRQEKATTELTAIVDSTQQKKNGSHQFAFAALERGSIRIATLNDMPAIADRARQELRL